MALSINPETGEFFDLPDELFNRDTDINITLGGVMANGMGDPVPGLQADSPYTPAEQVLLPGQGETSLTADVPYVNASDTTSPGGFNASSSGAPRNIGGVGEWLTNGFKSLSNGFLGVMSGKPGTGAQPGGAFGSPGPGFTNRFSTAGFPGVTGSTSSQGMAWILGLGVLLVFVLFSGRR